MKLSIEKFSQMKELSPLQQARFGHLVTLNDMLDSKNPGMYYELYRSYIKNILMIWEKNIDFSDYSSLDKEVYRVMNLPGEAINSVINFAHIKFKTIMVNPPRGDDFIRDIINSRTEC